MNPCSKPSITTLCKKVHDPSNKIENKTDNPAERNAYELRDGFIYRLIGVLVGVLVALLCKRERCIPETVLYVQWISMIIVDDHICKHDGFIISHWYILKQN